MNNAPFRTVLFGVAGSALILLAWGQGGTANPGIRGPVIGTSPITQTPAYFLKEIEKLKKQSSELKDKLAAAEARIASVEAKNTAQDSKIANKEDKMTFGSDYAGGGWTNKHNFLTTLDPNKTMIRYVRLK